MSKIKCKQCGTILESKRIHDFVSCNCDNETFIDGGDVYMRAGGKNLDLIEVLSDSNSDN